MLRLKDVRPSDFAYFDHMENKQTKTAVKTAFKYIVSLANLSGTFIEDWDLEYVFKKDGKWLTEKGEINKALFEYREEYAKLGSIVPEEVRAAVEIPLKGIFEGQGRRLKDTIEQLKASSLDYSRSIQRNTEKLRAELIKLTMFEAAQKTSDKNSFQLVEKVLTELPFKIFDATRDSVSFICTVDTIVEQRALGSKINRQYNLGRLIVRVNVRNFQLTIERLDYGVNRWYRPQHAHFHFCMDRAHFCAGGFANDQVEAANAVDFFKIMEMVNRWRTTLDTSSTLVSTMHFNHHPAFTTYLEGDFLFGLTELEMAKQLGPGGVYFCAPLMKASEYMTGLGVYHNFSEQYPFKKGGGVIDSGYQLERKSLLLQRLETERLKDLDPIIMADVMWILGEYPINNDILHGEPRWSSNGERVYYADKARSTYLTVDDFIELNGLHPDAVYRQSQDAEASRFDQHEEDEEELDAELEEESRFILAQHENERPVVNTAARRNTDAWSE